MTLSISIKKILIVLSLTSLFTISIATAHQQQARVAVIGAGLAGLSAAYTISKGVDGDKGGWRVDLFEATNRVGGRVWSGELCTKVNNKTQCQTMEYGGELIDSGHEAMLAYAERFDLTVEDRLGCKAPAGFSGLNLKCASTPSSSSPTGLVDENGLAISTLSQINSVSTPGNNVTLYTADELQDDWFKQGKPKDTRYYVTNDLKSAGYPTTFDNFNSDGQYLDSLSLTGYLQRLAGFGVTDKFLQYLKVAYVGEYGLEPDEQSSLNTLFLLGYSPKKFSVFGESDERYHIAGGNENIIKKLKSEILLTGSTINYNHRLIKVERLNNGKYKLTFDHPMTSSNSTQTVYIYDRIVLAIPFSVMRDIDPTTGANFKNLYGWSVDISQAGFSPLKMTAINELYMGRNAKVVVQFKNRYWRSLGFDGDTYSTAYVNDQETRYQNSWESTRGQKGNAGILTNYVSGDRVANIPNSLKRLWWDPLTNNNDLTTPVKVSSFLSQLNELMPGAVASSNFAGIVANTDLSDCNANNGEDCNRYANVAAINWMSNPYARGSYATYAPGQYVKFAGYEPVPEPCNTDPLTCLDPTYDSVNRNAHFAGEHTSYDFLGYMEGAAVSGQRAGQEVRKVFKSLNIPKDFN